MNNFLLAITIAAAAGTLALTGLLPNEGSSALLLSVPLAAGIAFGLSQSKDDSKFLVRLFVSAFTVRLFLGTIIYYLHLQDFFGADANTFDTFGNAMARSWEGDVSSQYYVEIFSRGGSSSGWGMLYYVGVIYKLIGRNMLATQYVNCVIGAATAPLAYFLSKEIFPNRKVTHVTALLVAFYPSLILWTCQGLKDGPIIFLLAISMFATLKLGNQFSAKYVVILAVSLFCLITLRFYVFYIISFAIICAFIMGRRQLNAQAFMRQFLVMLLIGSALGAVGAQYVSRQIDTYGSFHQLQAMRLDASQSAASGFGQDIDVSTPEGAISAIPIGLCYLLLAPFPWHFTNLRQAITLPEMIIWWGSLPMLAFGLWFTIKHRLREVAPILIFLSLLTISYSIVQGNVGTAYRQRAQLLVFYFIFVGVGYALFREKREERARQHKAAKQGHHPTVEWRPEGQSQKDRMPVTG